MKIARWCLWVAAGLMLFVVVLHLVLPLVLRTERFKGVIAERLQIADGDQARFADIHPRLLPWPGLRIDDIHFVRPGLFSLTADSISLHPKIAPLLRGRILIDTARLTSPTAIVHLPSDAKPVSGPAEPRNISAAAVMEKLPDGLHTIIDDGRLTFMRNGRSVARIHDLYLQIVKDGHTLTAAAKGRSDWADRFHLDADLDSGTLDGTGRLNLTGADAALWESLVRPGLPAPTIQARVDLRVTVQSRAAQSWHITFDSTAPTVTLTHAQQSATGRKLLIQGDAQWTPEHLHASVSRLQLAHPELNLSGSLDRETPSDDSKPSFQLRMQAHDSDVTAIREALQPMIGEHPLWRFIRGGTLVSFTLDASGDSFSSLADMQNMRLSGKAADAQLFIPGVDLHLTDVNGQWRYSEGVLTAEQANARLDKNRGQNGTLKLGLRDDARFLQLDIDIKADLAQLPPLLSRLLPQPGLHAEIERLRSVKGSADGHLSISGPLNGLAVAATVSGFSLTADYDRLPFPVTAEGVGMTVDNQGITLTQGDVRLGRSAAQGLSGKFTWRDPPQIDIQAGDAQLDGAQLYSWLARFSVLRETFKDIESVGGRLTLANTRLKGPLRAAGQWQFASSGTVSGLAVRHARLPDMLSVATGSFAVQPESLNFSGVRAFMLDGDILADLQIDGYRAARPRMALSGQGILGKKAAAWLQRILDIPCTLNMRAPIGINRVKAVRQEGTPTRLEGEFSLPGDLTVGIDLSFSPDHLDVQRLTLSDERSDARMALRHDPSRQTWALMYGGILESATLAKLWRNSPVFAERIEGDFSAQIAVARPEDSRVQGQLKASNVIWDAAPWGSLIIRQLDMETQQNTLQIRRLDMGLDEQRASITGKADINGQGISLDIAVSAHTLDLERLEQAFRPAPEQNIAASEKRPGKPALPDWTARIDMAVERMEYGSYTLQPLHAILTLEKERVEIQVNQAYACGIFLQGNGRWTPEGLWIELIPQAAGQPLQFAAGCLTGTPSTERIEGTYKVDGRLTTHGNNSEALTRNLKGTVHLEAVDGRVFNTGSVGFFSNLLSFLQINNLIAGDLPNLKGDDFWYNRILLQLEFNDGFAELIEADVLSDGLNMVGEGRIHLLDQRLELTVLVSPLTTVDSIIRRIPIIGRILKGTLVAIPVGVKGSLSNPRITPLSPRAVGARLLGIMERILEAPFQLIEPIFRSREEGQEPAPHHPISNE